MKEMIKDQPLPPGAHSEPGFWLETLNHRNWLMDQAMRQFEFFSASCLNGLGLFILGHDGSPQPGEFQELHTTARMFHSYALRHLAGFQGADQIIDHGMTYLKRHHRDRDYGGYVWALEGDQIKDDRKLAYGHVLVLLASASAKLAGHPEADRLMADAREVLDQHFWDKEAGLYCDEWNRDGHLFPPIVE